MSFFSELLLLFNDLLLIGVFERFIRLGDGSMSFGV